MVDWETLRCVCPSLGARCNTMEQYRAPTGAPKATSPVMRSISPREPLPTLSSSYCSAWRGMHNSARANVILHFARLVWGLQRALGSGSAAVLLQLGRFNQRNAYASSPSFKERYPVTALPLTGHSLVQLPLSRIQVGSRLIHFIASWFFLLLLFYGLLGNAAAHLFERLAHIHPSNIYQVHRRTFGGSILQPLNCHQPRRFPCSLALHLCPLGIATWKIPKAQSRSCKTRSVWFLLVGPLLQKHTSWLTKRSLKNHRS